MKVVILAGGMGSRLSEHTETRPKPMVEVGPYPILWHVMNIYASHGFDNFVVACGHKADVIKEYFHTFFIRHSDYVVNLRDGREEIVRTEAPDWKISVVDTGLKTQTGGRVRRLGPGLGETFMVTYGDGVGDVNIRNLAAFHRSHGKLATVTAVRPPARFGSLILEHGSQVKEFCEKPQVGEGWISGGFFVFERAVLDYIENDATMLERQPLERLAAEGQLHAYRHDGFWQPMDTVRDKRILDEHWESGKAPWKTW